VSELPSSVADREITIAGITFRQHVLDDGRRVIEKAGMDKLIKRMQARTISGEDAARIATWAKGDA
jgi:hypothetical protein